MHRWAWLTGIPHDYLYDAIATRMKGGAATWMNNQLQVAARNQRMPWATWAEFCDALRGQFEPISREERARRAIHDLKQTGSVGQYIYRFNELRAYISSMNQAEAWSLFLGGLQVDLQWMIATQIVGEDLEAAIELVKKAAAYIERPKKEK